MLQIYVTSIFRDANWISVTADQYSAELVEL